eukprot:m.317436 g.317436  ORF g.317436 m.317436 type:complete len:319 (+) comp55474_c0_seq1:813-1769(+)
MGVHAVVLCLVALCAVPALQQGPYAFTGNPYTESGNLNPVQFYMTPKEKLGPMHAYVISPSVPGNYSIFIFDGGMHGFIISEAYSKVLYNISDHGFIVVGLDPSFPADPHSTVRENPYNRTVLGEEIDAILHSIQAQINQRATGVIADTSRLSFGCHSAGCGNLFHYFQTNSSILSAFVFLEPFVEDPLTAMSNYSIPVLAYGTQMSTEFPACTFYRTGFHPIYDYWNCPKVLVNVTNFGHCDFLDTLAWEACHDIHMCKSDKKGDRALYREYVQGLVSAFLTTFVNNYLYAYAYLSNHPSGISYGEMEQDVTCVLLP